MLKRSRDLIEKRPHVRCKMLLFYKLTTIRLDLRNMFEDINLASSIGRQ